MQQQLLDTLIAAVGGGGGTMIAAKLVGMMLGKYVSGRVGTEQAVLLQRISAEAEIVRTETTSFRKDMQDQIRLMDETARDLRAELDQCREKHLEALTESASLRVQVNALTTRVEVLSRQIKFTKVRKRAQKKKRV